MDKQLKEYIAKSRKGGQTDLQIMNDLAAAGWPEDQILDALRPDLRPPKPPLIQLTPKQLKMVIFIGGSLLICVVLIVVFGILISRSGPTGKKIAKTDNNSKKEDRQKKDEQSSKTDPTKTPTPTAAALHEVGSTLITIKKIRSGSADIKSTAFFYDIAKQSPLSGFSELTDSSNLHIGKFSPDGKYMLFKTQTYNQGADSDIAVFYLYDTVNHSIKVLKKYSTSISYDDLLNHAAMYSYIEVSQWLDASTIYLGLFTNSAGQPAGVAINLNGEVKEVASADEKIKHNKSLKFKMFNIQNSKQGYNVTEIGGKTYDLKLTNAPLGMKDNQIVAFYRATLDPTIPEDSQKLNEITDLYLKDQTNGLSVVNQIINEYFKSKKPSSIFLINPDTGNIDSERPLSAGGWYAEYAYYDPIGNMAFAFETNAFAQPAAERILILSLDGENIDSRVIKSFDNSVNSLSMASSNIPFIVDYDGKYIYYIRTESTDGTSNTATNRIYQIDINSGETKTVCAEICSDPLLFNPNSFN